MFYLHVKENQSLPLNIFSFYLKARSSYKKNNFKLEINCTLTFLLELKLYLYVCAVGEGVNILKDKTYLAACLYTQDLEKGFKEKHLRTDFV